ncbi:DoxX family protein [Streptomyces bottropensis ATCC 25435]|uniref:DoxX family protein n=1 Tax=Streptomyces bottropensis ATCC 25435 TaxID=1054862 RepID=M3EM71_9ACTN|nr:DoxX family protein [Streptomyces bottropensis ATCC 25435]
MSRPKGKQAILDQGADDEPRALDRRRADGRRLPDRQLQNVRAQGEAGCHGRHRHSTGPRQVDDFSPGALKTIGAVELLASAGLIPPAALGVAPVLVPPAATGLVLPLHASRAEHPGRREPVSPILTVTRRSGTP